MKFPVDLLADVSQAELEQSAHNYMNNLLYRNPDSPERLTLSDSTQVTINSSSVGFVPLYGAVDKQKILALFSPSDPLTAVALYLRDQWWAVDAILKTADSAREGVVQVETIGERIVLYILNRVVYRAKEMSSEELPFLCHGEKDYAKIIWNNGEAVGFYSVKPTGSLCKAFSTRCYQLPVMDSMFVRKCHRGKGFGLQMLEDYVLSFKEDCLGLRYPLTKPMYKVCDKYLRQYPGDVDLLWEVESIGGPNQRTNIAIKIQAMDLSAVSKSLSFTEELLGITEVTEQDVVMEAITTRIKETGSVVCTEEIVEEVTVLRASKVSEAELPITARGRSSGSKRRNMGEKITEEMSEKVIRIEDIEPETPREEQVSARQETEMHDVSELVQTEAMFSVGPEENGEDVDDNAPKEEAATMSDKPATVLPSQDLEETAVTSAPTTKETQVDDTQQNLNNSPHDPQITVENVSSEIEEAEEECQKESTVVLVVLEEVSEVHKEAETQTKVGEGNQIEVTDEKSEERVTQHVLSLSTHATSEGSEAGKSGRSVVKAIKITQSETPRQRSERHRKPEEEQTTSLDGGRILRRRTVMITPISKRKYTKHSQKVHEELEKEDEDSTTEEVEGLAVTVGEEPEEIISEKDDVVEVEHLREDKRQQLEDEQLTITEETMKEEEPRVEETTLKGSSTEPPDTTETALTKENGDEKVTDESEKEQKDDEGETSVIEDKPEVSDDEREEPPVVHQRALRGRRKVTPKPQPTKQSRSHQKREERTADEKATDKEMVEQGETVDKAEKEILTEEEGTTVIIGVCKEIQEDKDAEGETEEEANDMIKEPDAVASETVPPDEVLDETASAGPEESEEKDTGSEILKLKKATVILVDLKTTCHSAIVKQGEQTAGDGEYAAPEKEEMEQEGAEEVENGDATMTITEEEENTAGVTDTPSPNPATDSAILASKEEATASAEEQQSEESAPQLSDLQRVTVVLVDLKKTHLIQEETSAVEEGVLVEKSAAEVEDEQSEEHVPGSPAGTEGTEPEKVQVEKDSFGEKVEDADTIQDTGDTGEADETAKEDEAKSADDEEEEPTVTETRTQRSRKQAAKATPKSKRPRGRPKKGTTKRTDKQPQEEDEERGEESAAAEEREAEEEEEQQQVIDQEKEERTDAQDATQQAENVEPEAPVGQNADEGTALDDVAEEEEAPVIETRHLRSGEKTVRASARSKTTKREAQEEEATGEESSEGDISAVETRVLRKSRRSAAATPRRKSKRARKQCEEEEEEVEETTQAEEMIGGGTKADEEEDNSDEKKEERDGGEAVTQRDETAEPEAEMKHIEAVAEEALAEQETVEEEESALSEASANGLEETPVGESAEEAPDTDDGKVTDEDLPVVETRVLRSGGKTTKATPRSKTTKSQQEENEEEEGVVEKSADTDEPAVETRVLRRGRRSAPDTPLHKSKRGRTQRQPEEEEEEETGPAEEEEEAEQELPEEKGEMAEEEGKSVEIGVKNVEEEEVDGVAGGESAVGDTEQMKDASTEEATVLEAVAVDETDTDTVKVEETNSAEEEETTEVGSHSTEEALVADTSMVTEEEAPAVTTRTRRSKTKTVHATPSRRSRRQKEEGVVETQQQQEENPEDEKTKEVHQVVDDSHENTELDAKEEAETDETSPTGQEAAPAEDNAEDQAEEMADLIDNRVVEPTGEEPATEEMESAEEEPSTVEGRSLRGRKKAVDKEKDKAKRRSIRKRPRVDYRENDEGGESEEEEDKVESVEDKDDKKAEHSSNEADEEESRREEELEDNMGAVESTSEKGDVMNLALDTDEEVETAASSQEEEEDEQNMSEEEVEPIVIGKRVLRGRSVPSLIITPQAQSRRRSARVQKSEESLSDEEKSPQTAQRRSLRKRKHTEVTPTRKSKRHSRV